VLSGLCERSGEKRPLTPDNSEAIGAPGFANRGDAARWDCRMDVVSRRMGLFEAKDGEVALSVLGIRGDVARGVEEDDVGSSSGSKVASRGVMGLGMPGM
jgi:hypothetical protein